MFDMYDQEVHIEQPTGDFPTLIMDKIDFDTDWKKTLSDTKLIAEMERVADILREDRLLGLDVEYVYDKKTDKIMLLDAAGVIQVKREESSVYEAELYYQLAMAFARNNESYQGVGDAGISVRKVNDALQTGNKKYIYDIVTRTNQ